MHATPRLSFIVPAHNEEFELPAALASIRHAADASGEPYEIIVADDASTDRTAELAAAAGATVVPIVRRQIAAARNAGAARARGEIFFFVDADSRIAPAHVSGALAALAQGCAGGSARVQLDGIVPFWARVFLRAFCAVYYGANLGVGAFIFAGRDTFRAAGGFDEQYFAGEETYLTLALKRFGRFKILQTPVVTSGRKVRMHSSGHVLAQFAFIVFGGRGALRTRERLDLWYDGKREQNAE